MSNVVALTPTGACVRGVYDGYGSILSDTSREGEGLIGYEPVAAYHRACWVLLGQPRKVEKLSDGALDQGYFCATQPEVPMTIEDLARLREANAEHDREAEAALEEAFQSLGRTSP